MGGPWIKFLIPDPFGIFRIFRIFRNIQDIPNFLEYSGPEYVAVSVRERFVTHLVTYTASRGGGGGLAGPVARFGAKKTPNMIISDPGTFLGGYGKKRTILGHVAPFLVISNHL